MTRREEIMAILSKDKISVQTLANKYRCEMREILEDMEHIEKSIKPRRLLRDPAFCKNCGWRFLERSRIKTPSKCPRCKAEWIEASVFYI